MQIPVIKAAKTMGLIVTAVDKDKDAPGMAIADTKVIRSIHDVDGILSSLDKKPSYSAVLTVATNAAVTVAKIAQKFNLAASSVAAATTSSDKLIMKDAFMKSGVLTPEYSIVNDQSDINKFMSRHCCQVVLKPRDCSGSRGVTLIETEQNIGEAFNQARKYSNKLIVEKYYSGDELSIDALISNGQIHIAGVADRLIGHKPYFVENGHILPSNKSKTIIEKAIKVTKAAIWSLGIDNGAAKADIKVHNGNCMMLEMANRLSGGLMSTHTYPYATGVDLMSAVIRLALGHKEISLEPIFSRVSYESALIPQEGTICSFSGIENAKESSGVMDLILRAKCGDYYASPKNNLEKVGYIVVCEPTRKEAVTSMRRAKDKLGIRIS